MDNTALKNSLSDLALDLRWSWNHEPDELWNRLDPDLWALTHNPWVILQTVSRPKLDRLPRGCGGPRKLEQALNITSITTHARTGSRPRIPTRIITAVAYFSMEFMLSDALPIYSGAWATWRAISSKPPATWACRWSASGCFISRAISARRSIGRQSVALYPYNDPGQLPISPLREANGEWLRISMKLPGFCFGFAPGRCKLGAPSSTCSTRTIPRIYPLTEASPANSTAADRNCACNRNACWASAAGVCCARSGSIPKFAI